MLTPAWLSQFSKENFKNCRHLCILDLPTYFQSLLNVFRTFRIRFSKHIFEQTNGSEIWTDCMQESVFHFRKNIRSE